MQNKGENGFKVIEGKIPVLLSAPHAFPHRRPSLGSKYKQKETWTDYIVSNVANESKCFGILTTESLEYDPNYHQESNNPYKQKVREIVEQNKISYVFDIHGLSDTHRYDFGVFYKPRYLRSKRVAYQLASYLSRDVLRNSIVQILYFDENKQETIGEYVVKQLGVVGIQLEISWYLLDDEVLRNGLIKALTKFAVNL